MNSYKSIRDLDEYWIGEVPKTWKSSRIKNVVCISPNFSEAPPEKGEECTIVPMEAVTVKGDIDNSRKEKFENIMAGLTYFENGDVLFAKITPCMENGKGAYVKNIDTRYGFGSTEFHVLRPTHRINGEFLYYCIFNTQYREFAALNMTGAAGQKRVPSKFLAYTRIYLPEIKQQVRIAGFLNNACASIDTTIGIKQKQLETLEALKKSIINKAVTQGLDDSVEMKDSGVLWMGKIPMSWKVEKLKHISNLIVDGTHITPTYLNEGIPFLRVTDLQNKIIDLRKTKYISEEEHRELCKRVKPQKGDILLSKNGTIGIVRVIDWDWEFSIFVSLCLIRLFNGMNQFYFSYYFESDVVDQQLFQSSKKTSVTNLHLVKIRELLLSRPPLLEQSRIVEYLDQKTAEIEKLKKNIIKQIETLELYRKSIIHECVTGKRRVAVE